MHSTGKQLAGWHSESSHLFESGHTDIEDATSGGWVGDSRIAMEAALRKMRDSAATLTGRLDDHSTKFHGAFPTYHGGDRESGGEIGRIGSHGPRLTNL